MESVSIPSSVKKIADSAFERTGSMTIVNVTIRMYRKWKIKIIKKGKEYEYTIRAYRKVPARQWEILNSKEVVYLLPLFFHSGK